jgi:CRP-like cAMP-binding protein
MLPNEPRISELASCFTTKEVSAGTYLQRRGDRSDDVYLVGKGRVCACLPMPNGRELRLRSMTSGSIIGEAAFYSGETRTADLRVEQDAVIHCLSRTVLDDLNQTDLGLSLALHQLLGGSLVEKLASANALINTMMPKSGAGEPS